MRGWSPAGHGAAGVPDAALVFVLEELDTGTDPYLVAAAARALRSYPRPGAALVPFVRDGRSPISGIAMSRCRSRSYGDYAVSATGTSAVRELLATPAWLGPHASGAVPQRSRPCLRPGGLPPKLRGDVRAARCRPFVTPAGDRGRGRRARSPCCGAQAPPPTMLRQCRGDRRWSCWRITRATGSASRRSSAASPRSWRSSTRAATIR